MKPHRRERHKGRKEGGSFIALAHAWIKSPQWAALSPFELKLLIDLGSQYNGRNNGDLCAALSVMKGYGWRSSATLNKAIRGLIAKGWLDLSRQGGRHLASLYALTIWGIDECDGKHHLRANPTPTHRWKTDGLKNSLNGRAVKQCGRVVMQLATKEGHGQSRVVVS